MRSASGGWMDRWMEARCRVKGVSLSSPAPVACGGVPGFRLLTLFSLISPNPLMTRRSDFLTSKCIITLYSGSMFPFPRNASNQLKSALIITPTSFNAPHSAVRFPLCAVYFQLDSCMFQFKENTNTGITREAGRAAADCAFPLPRPPF